jgi:hypothetical protein
VPDPRSGSGSIRGDGTPRGEGSSRLEAFHSLRAAHADLQARLRRPTLRPGGRYRDLVVSTRLLELEREHLAGRTAYSSTGTEAVAGASGGAEHMGESDPDWSLSWGTAASLELHRVLRRHSARRERLGRLLTPAARARATKAADQRYDAIALSVPWRAPDGRRPAPPPVPTKSVTRPATAEGFPRVRRGTRPSYGFVTAGAAAALALSATLVVLDRQGPEPGPGLQVDAGAALSAAAAPSFQRIDPVPAASPSAKQARKARDRPPARRNPDGGASPPEPEAEPEPASTDTAVPTNAPAPAPAPASTPATPPAAPAPAPPPEPSPPATEDPPEFGFEQ